jgi:hypothetical protein
MSEADEKEAAAVQKGLQRAFGRLGMVFETSEHYLDFWFPGQNFTLEGLPPDLADYYSYDLERTDGDFVPKASREAAEEDALSVLSESPTAAALGGVGCPVALIRAAEGFFSGSEPHRLRQSPGSYSEDPGSALGATPSRGQPLYDVVLRVRTESRQCRRRRRWATGLTAVLKCSPGGLRSPRSEVRSSL